MKKLIVRLALWMARSVGIDLVAFPRVDDEVIEVAKTLCAQVETQETSGEHKRAQVLRGLINRFPNVSERALASAIERALCLG